MMHHLIYYYEIIEATGQNRNQAYVCVALSWSSHALISFRVLCVRWKCFRRWRRFESFVVRFAKVSSPSARFNNRRKVYNICYGQKMVFPQGSSWLFWRVVTRIWSYLAAKNPSFGQILNRFWVTILQGKDWFWGFVGRKRWIFGYLLPVLSDLDLPDAWRA